MLGYKLACKYYGIIPYGREEEENLTDEEKLTRQCKIDVIDMVNQTRKLLDQIERRAKGAPESKDPKDATLLRDFRSKMRNAKAAVDEAAMFGII